MNIEITSNDYARLSKLALTTIGDLRHVETALTQVNEEAARLGIRPITDDNASEIQVLGAIANMATEKEYDLKRKEALEATAQKTQTIINRPHRSVLGRFFSRAAEFVG